MGLAVVLIGKESGLIDASLYNVFVGFTIISSLITPILMGWALKKSLPVED